MELNSDEDGDMDAGKPPPLFLWVGGDVEMPDEAPRECALSKFVLSVNKLFTLFSW